MRETVLEISGVDQIFRTGFWMKRVQVLFQVELTVPRKSIFGFLGANGAGKTTLIHLIAGLRKPSRGTVRAFGQAADSIEAKAKIGYLPERPYFHEHLTGQALLEYFGTLAGLRRSEIRNRIPEVLSAVGMSHARKTELKRYSKGMLQRIGIAQALLHDPELLVLDEPMSGLDPLGRKEMREVILRLSAEGRTIFFSTHVIPDLEAICDQVAWIRGGRIVKTGPIRDFLVTEDLQTEICFSGIHDRECLGWPDFDSIREVPDGYRAQVSQPGKLETVLSRLLAKGARIQWITPIRPSLEDLFKSGGNSGENSERNTREDTEESKSV